MRGGDLFQRGARRLAGASGRLMEGEGGDGNAWEREWRGGIVIGESGE